MRLMLYAASVSQIPHTWLSHVSLYYLPPKGKRLSMYICDATNLCSLRTTKAPMLSNPQKLSYISIRHGCWVNKSNRTLTWITRLDFNQNILCVVYTYIHTFKNSLYTYIHIRIYINYLMNMLMLINTIYVALPDAAFARTGIHWTARWTIVRLREILVVSKRTKDSVFIHYMPIR